MRHVAPLRCSRSRCRARRSGLTCRRSPFVGPPPPFPPLLPAFPPRPQAPCPRPVPDLARPQALHFLLHAFASLSPQPGAEAEPHLLLAAAHALALALRCGVADLVTEAAATAARLCLGPAAVAAMVDADTPAAIVAALPGVEDAALRASLLGTLTLLCDEPAARAAARAGGAAAVLGAGLERAHDAEAKLLHANALSALAHGEDDE